MGTCTTTQNDNSYKNGEKSKLMTNNKGLNDDINIVTQNEGETAYPNGITPGICV